MKLGDITLLPAQESAVKRMKVGNILAGGVGSGKTFTSIFWAYYNKRKDQRIYVITTAKKRDDIEEGKDKPDWQSSLEACGITDYVVDSWNNLWKYEEVKDSLFLFDEHRAVGQGKWAKLFIKIARQNKWILLSATPGDSWMDWSSAFIANGFYRNITQYRNEHVEFEQYTTYPKIKGYKNTEKLEQLRKQIVIPMTVLRHTKRKRIWVTTSYDREYYDKVKRLRFDFEQDKPIETASAYTQYLRKIVATSQGRQDKAYEIMFGERRLIIFYNYDYEREILLKLAAQTGKTVAEYNGHVHQGVPTGDDWIYLVNYLAGAEGWNCITTDALMFYSPSYSYKQMEQAEGRIDRMNTPYTELKYYWLKSGSSVDKAVLKAVEEKKQFNERTWNKDVSNYFRKSVPKQNTQASSRKRVPGRYRY